MSASNEDPIPTSRFTYPFPVPDASNGESNTREASDPQEYYEALAEAEDGFYPIGYNGQWHGGVHFGAQTGQYLCQGDGVRCIADGEVIAWKIDKKYPKVEYATCGRATYSTGFVLVRHRLQLPEADGEGAGTAVGEAADANEEAGEQQEPSLLFYSLYIHLLDRVGYTDAPDKPRPAFWGEPAYLVGEKANDSNRSRNPHIPEGGVGLNLRNAANAIVGVALRGTQLHLGERRGATGYYAVTSVECGAVLPADLDLANVYAFKEELTPVPVNPPDKGEVVIPDTPVSIAAGDLIGHLGQYQRYIDMNPLGSACNERELMQIDVFTTDDIEAFIKKSRERSAQLSDRHKTLLLIEKGASLILAPDVEGSPTGEQLAAHRNSSLAPEVAHPRVIPIRALGEAVTEEDGTRWWSVEVGNGGGESVWGWVCEKDHAGVSLCTPWDWPGFEIVQVDSTRPDQFYANQIHRQGNVTLDEKSEVEERGSAAESGSIFRKLYELVDDDGDQKIISDEIRRALKKPWLAQALSHLIIHHESEWSGPMGKWDAIDELIPKEREKDWIKEKERIKSLLWWEDLKGRQGLSNDEQLVAHNFHPVGFITNFSTGPCYCHRDLSEAELREIVVAMRLSEAGVYSLAGESLFSAENTSMSEEDKSYGRLVEEVNAAFNRFEINTCLRKIHFLAQAYWEADRLRTTKEYGSGHRYEPYVGRGLMQLTWKDGYKKYESYSGLNCVESPDLLSDSLNHSVLSAAWYWNQGKELSLGAVWAAPASAPDYVRRHNPRYAKRTITYTYGGDQYRYGTIDLNLVADDDYVDVISWLVNGGSNGLAERRVYVTRLKQIMGYESACINRR